MAEVLQKVVDELRQGEFGKIYSYLELCAPSEECRHRFLTSDGHFKEQVKQTVDRLSTLGNGELEIRDSTLALRNLLDVVGAYASLIGYHRYQFALDMIESVAEDQTFAVRVAALAARERSVLIGHGYKGPAVSADGGINPQNIANRMRGAQVAASAVIMN